MSVSATVVEVGPRDGLQNEPAQIATADKIAFVERLADAGLPVIEVTAFVRADRVPQLADAGAVVRGIRRRPGTRYSALVPNLKGLELARAAELDEVAIFAAASETFSKRNINRSIAESLKEYREVCRRAIAAGMRVRGYVSTAFGCPFEGRVDPGDVADVCRHLLDMGVFEVAVSDTIGVAHPGQVPQVIEAVTRYVPTEQIALHFHDTRGTALANVLAALQLGVRTFDA
ncbi:MAG TPA: hydroxymethylglutaryl-CoA lyase, partial [Vicinamibacterales bacterium]